MMALPSPFDKSIPAWEKATYAFLAEKERRSGSRRTVDAYIRTLERLSTEIRVMSQDSSH